MKTGLPGDPIYWTYHMVEWGRMKQNPSDQKCVQCGGKMSKVEDVTDRKGNPYDGLVCHTCKRVLWVRLD